jgi:hypothetical protein
MVYVFLSLNENNWISITIFILISISSLIIFGNELSKFKFIFYHKDGIFIISIFCIYHFISKKMIKSVVGETRCQRYNSSYVIINLNLSNKKHIEIDSRCYSNPEEIRRSLLQIIGR